MDRTLHPGHPAVNEVSTRCVDAGLMPGAAAAIGSARERRLPWFSPRTLSSQPRRIAVPRLFWEDFVAGQVEEYGSRLLTREEIIAFAAEFDPQPMHLDEEAASATMLG